MISNRHIKGAAFAILAAGCWGMALVMSKSVLAACPPIPLLLSQLGASVLFLWVVLLLKKTALPGIKSLLGVSLLGLLEPFLTYVLVLIGLTYSRASDAALLQSLEPVFIIIIGFVLFKERTHKHVIYLSALMLVGLYFSLGDSLSGLVDNGLLGNALIIGGIVTAACYVVLTARAVAKAQAIVIVTYQQSIALVAALFAFIVESIFSDDSFSLPDGGISVLALFSGILQYALAFTFFLAALKHISAGLTGMFLNLIPVFGIVGAYLFLGEKMENVQMAGSAITIATLLAMSFLSGKAEGKQT
ncbi:DMT family transporter [Brenneria populi]|uniref:Threonine/homoserine exporter RhtA n=1 Tax=Brenneria populi TaxID=1505588 RepID=A0ABU6JKK7_9GAMM|nr:DMT family transporter [Brenneria populi Li et al. 2015]